MAPNCQEQTRQETVVLERWLGLGSPLAEDLRAGIPLGARRDSRSAGLNTAGPRRARHERQAALALLGWRSHSEEGR